MKNRKTYNTRIAVSDVLAGSDAVVFAAMCAASVCAVFRSTVKAVIAGIAVFCFAAAFLLIRLRRNKRMKGKKHLADAANAIRTERILLLSDKAIEETLQEPNLYVIRRTEVSESDMLNAIAAHPNCIASVSDTERFLPLIETHAPKTRLVDLRKHTEMLGVACTEEEAEKRLEMQRKQRRKSFRFRPDPGNGRIRFFALGILLLVLSLVWKHKIYYRILSSACFGLSVITGVFYHFGNSKFFALFLDNNDK